MPRKDRSRKRGGRNNWCIDQELARSVPERLGIKFDEEHLDLLEEAAVDYYKREHIKQDQPRPKEVKSSIKEIVATSTKFWHLLDELDIVSRNLMKIKYQEITECKEILEEIKLKALRASNKVDKDVGGRPDQSARQQFIKDLIRIYESAGAGTATFTTDPYSQPEEYKGDFLDFVYACVENIGKTPESRGALAIEIKKVRQQIDKSRNPTDNTSVTQR